MRAGHKRDQVIEVCNFRPYPVPWGGRRAANGVKDRSDLRESLRVGEHITGEGGTRSTGTGLLHRAPPNTPYAFLSGLATCVRFHSL